MGKNMAEAARNEFNFTDVNSAEGKRLLIIEGVRENGTRLRPSDWPERISSTFAIFGKDHRLHYMKDVQPQVFKGQKVLAVDLSLAWTNPEMFKAVIKFARDNNLRTSEESVFLD